MSQQNDDTTTSQKPIPELDQSRSDSENIKELQPQALYDLNQQALEGSYSDGPLIHEVAPLSTLRSEYEANENHIFVKEIEWLIGNGYKHFRRVKGDGDCFYRAIGFAFFSQLLGAPDKEMAVVTTISTLAATRQLLSEAGVQELVFEDFYDYTVQLVQNIIIPDKAGSILTLQKLLECFRDTEGSNMIVMYLRLVTSSQIQANIDEFEFFLFHPDTREPMSVPDYCNRVMALGKEADHAEIKALCDAFRWNVEVAYLGGQSKDAVNFVKIPDTPYPGFEPVVLLYRPGHYDILLK